MGEFSWADLRLQRVYERVRDRRRVSLGTDSFANRACCSEIPLSSSHTHTRARAHTHPIAQISNGPNKGFVEAFDNLKAHSARVLAREGIAAWVAKRPESAF